MDSYELELDRLIKHWLGVGETADVILRGTLRRIAEMAGEESRPSKPSFNEAIGFLLEQYDEIPLEQQARELEHYAKNILDD